VGLLREGWTALAAAVLPVECAGCRVPDVPLCRPCAAQLTRPAWTTVPPDPGCPPVAVVAPYAGEVRELLVAWKDHGRHDLHRQLAPALAAAVRLAAASAASAPAAGPLLLVPAPSARRVVRRRGEDVVARLTRAAAAGCRRAGTPVRVAVVLRQARRVRDQAGLDAAARAANLSGALALRPGASALLAGRRCLLVDDVVTTGATLAEASRVVTGAGALVVGGAAVAATPRRLPRTAQVSVSPSVV
jgi:predicted amidophosphoribosyltransferase